MYQSSFTIDAWQTEESPLTLNYREMPVQNSQKKCKNGQNRQQSKLKKLQFTHHNKEQQTTQQSIKSLACHRRVHTQQIESFKLNFEKQKSTNRDSQKEIFSTKTGNAPFFTSVVKIFEKSKFPEVIAGKQSQKQAKKQNNSRQMKSSHYAPKHKNAFSEIKMPKNNHLINSPSKVTNIKIKDRFPKMTIRQQKLKFFKDSFLKSYEQLGLKRFNTLELTCEKRWKNMMLKAKRKNKELEDLFRTKKILNVQKKKKIEGKQKDKTILIINSSESACPIFTHLNRQFSDQVLYCNYKESKLKKHCKINQQCGICND